MRTLLTLFVAVNPPAVAGALRGLQPRHVVAVAAASTVVVAGACALLSRPALEALDVTPATFQVAAAVVLGIAGVRWVAVGPWRLPEGMSIASWRHVVVPLLLPALVTPQVVVVSTSLGADHGVGTVVAGAAVALALAWVACGVRARPLAWSVASRFVGAGAIVLALALAIEGVKTV